MDWGEGLVVTKDSQGRYYLGGTLNFGSFDPAVGFTAASDFRWYVARLTPELELDTTYGDDGFAVLSWGNDDAELTSILVDVDGKVVAGGIDYAVTPTRTIKVARFNTDGSLDSGFATSGVATLTTSTATYFQLGFIAFQSTGKIVVMTGEDIGGKRRAKLRRLNTNGTADTAFGAGGVENYQYNSNNNDTAPWSLLVTSDDKIYIGGMANASSSGGTHQLAFLARLTSEGDHDPTWANDTGLGQYAAIFDGPQEKHCQFTALVEEPVSGKIIGVGDASSSPTHTGILVTRWTTTGALDTSYGASSGYTINNFGLLAHDACDWAGLDSQGRIMFAGQTANDGSNYYTPTTRFLVGSFNANGTVRTGFGTNGAVSPVVDGDNQNCAVFYGAGSYNVINDDDSMVLAGHVNSDRPGWPGSGVTSVACAVKLNANGSVDVTVGDVLP